MTWKCLRLTCLLYKGIHTSKCTENTSFIYPLSCDYFNLSIFIPYFPFIPPWTTMFTSFFFPLAFPNVRNSPFRAKIFIIRSQVHDFIIYVIISFSILNLMLIFINIIKSNFYIYIYMTGRYFINISIYLTLYNISLSHILSQKTLPIHSPS